MTGVLIRRGHLDRDTDREKTAVYKPQLGTGLEQILPHSLSPTSPTHSFFTGFQN